MRRLWFAMSVIWSLVACNTGQQEAESIPTDTQHIEFATGFEIGSLNGYPTLTIKRPFPSATTTYRYILLPETSDEEPPEGYSPVRVPVRSMICTSTTHIALLDLLDREEVLVGFPNTKYIYSPEIREYVTSGRVTNLGPGELLNAESVLNLAPDLLMTYSMNGDLGQYEFAERAGIPLVLNADYLEETPLGRAEWIKFMGELLGVRQRADSVFNVIKNNYLALRQIVADTEERPTVISGILYGDTWFMPGGKSWAAQYFRDAGADYLWSADDNTGSIPLSFETVYEKGLSADFWIGVASVQSGEELLDLDSRYGDFRAFRVQQVYHFNTRISPEGGNDFFEMAIMRPDIVLGDLIGIFHPRLRAGDTLTYYKKISF